MMRHETDGEGARQRQFIDDARKLLNPSPVRTSHVPTWLKKKIRAAVKAKQVAARYSDPEMVLLNDLTWENRWLDHYGTTTWRDFKDVFVSEPYSVDGKTLSQIEQFAERLGLECQVDANSWHFPGWTIRILLWPKEWEQERRRIAQE